MSDTKPMTRAAGPAMGCISKLIEWPLLCIRGAVALLMVAMMSLITVDVICRYVISKPIIGSYEIVQVMLGLTTFLALPLVTLTGSHVTINLLDSFLSPRVRKLRDLVVMLLSILIVAVLATNLWTLGGQLEESGQTLGVIKIPMSIVVYTFGFLLLLTLAAQLLTLYRSLRHGNKRKEDL